MLVIALRGQDIEWQEAACYLVVWTVTLLLVVRQIASPWWLTGVSFGLAVVLLFRTGLASNPGPRRPT